MLELFIVETLLKQKRPLGRFVLTASLVQGINSRHIVRLLEKLDGDGGNGGWTSGFVGVGFVDVTISTTGFPCMYIILIPTMVESDFTPVAPQVR